MCIAFGFSRCSAHSRSVNGKPFPSLIEVTAEDLAVGLESGQFTSVDLVNVCSWPTFSERRLTKGSQAYIARISEVNSTLNVVTEVNPDGLAIAAQLDAERANGTIRG